MIKQLTFTAAVVVSGMVCAVPASAQLAHPTVIEGKVTQKAKVGTMVGAAIGQDATAVAGQNVIFEDTTVKGSVEQTAEAKTMVAAAIGQRTYATAIQNGIGVLKR